MHLDLTKSFTMRTEAVVEVSSDGAVCRMVKHEFEQYTSNAMLAEVVVYLTPNVYRVIYRYVELSGSATYINNEGMLEIEKGDCGSDRLFQFSLVHPFSLITLERMISLVVSNSPEV